MDARAAAEAALHALVGRLTRILAHRPEWCGHIGHALAGTGLIEGIVQDSSFVEVLGRVIIANPKEILLNQAQEAARRFERLPNGVGGVTPLNRPGELPRFHPYCQSVIDAPLVAAEMAVGVRPPPDVDERLKLINLRLVDPSYFDDALPAALHLYMEASRP